MLIRADARSIPLATDSVQTVVTSPPYLAQRLYGLDPREGGQERTLDAYVQWLADVFDEVRRILRPDGLAWLNIGDKSNGSGGGGGDWRPGPERRWKDRAEKLGGPRMFRDPTFDSACFLDVPGAVVHELIRRGWRLRLPIVWDKGVEERASLDYIRRPRWQHEMIFCLAPAPRHAARTKFYPSLLTETGSIWRFPPGGSGPSHLAPFPDELARRCILPTTLPGDVVFDPFDGSGTTRRVATELGRIGVATDLYAGVESHSNLLPERPRPSTSTGGLVTKPGTVDLKDLSRVGLKPATLYYVSRQITEGRTLEDLTLEQKLSVEQVEYLEELFAGDVDVEEPAS